jgi:very-short-patch-repair endonuclease
VIEDYLRRQDGVITMAQARRAGMLQDTINRRVQAGQWKRCAPGVYFADDRPFTDAARLRAVVWSYGPMAVVSGLSAAWWHNLVAALPEIVDVTVPRNSHGRARPGSRVRRRELADVDVIESRRLRTTALALTVLEAAVTRGGAAVMDSALQRRITLGELQRAHVRNRGRFGARAAQRLLAAAADGARSEAERRLIRLLREAHISGWQANYPVGGYFVDVAFPSPKVAIEIDGWAYHSDQSTFQNDRKRQNRIALLGWQVLRFTWLDLAEHPRRVLLQIRRAISAR